jgi:hypothetical protein
VVTVIKKYVGDKHGALQDGVSELALLFTGPRFVDLIREAVARGGPGQMPAALPRGGVTQ